MVGIATDDCMPEDNCTSSRAQITGLARGYAKVQAIVLLDTVRLGLVEFDITVTDYETAAPVELEDEIGVPERLEYEVISPMNSGYNSLKLELDEQKKLIENQQERLDDQNIRIQKTESVLQKILRMLKNLFS